MYSATRVTNFCILSRDEFLHMDTVAREGVQTLLEKIFTRAIVHFGNFINARKLIKFETNVKTYGIIFTANIHFTNIHDRGD